MSLCTSTTYHCRRCDVSGQGDRCWSCGRADDLTFRAVLPDGPLSSLDQGDGDDQARWRPLVQR